MDTITKVKRALIQSYNNYIKDDVLYDTIYTNRFFNGTLSREVWVELMFLPATKVQGSLGIGGQDIVEGLFQLTASVGKGKGTSLLSDFSDKALSFYIGGRYLLYEGVTVSIEGCYEASMITYGDRISLPINIPFNSRLTRPDPRI